MLFLKNFTIIGLSKMRYFVLIGFISFLSASVFGFLVINYSNHHQNCVAAIANGGVACPLSHGLFSLFSHLNILKNFSRAVFNYPPFFNLLKPLTSLNFIFFWLLINSFLIFCLTSINSQKVNLLFVSRKKIAHWLSFKIKTPPSW